MDYAKIVLLHRIAVSLFLFHYMWKGYLLASDKKDTLTGYVAKTKVAEMILSFLFLATGIYLVVAGPALTMLQYIKIAMVLASIPLAVIGFKKGNKALALLAVLLLFLSYGLAEMNKKRATKGKVDTTIAATPVEAGKLIYQDKCTRCHGDGGDANLAGAKNLKLTALSDEQQKAIIKGGNAGMPAFGDLTDEQLDGLVAYLKTLKQ
jgi:mono/diheme cytochrome c family protein